MWGAGVTGAQDLTAGVPVAPRPLELLMEHGDQLELTEPQIERLNRVRARLARANEPLVRRMLNLRRQWQQQRLLSAPDSARLARIRAAAEPVHARIQANNRTAMQAVNRVLTRQQRQRLRAIVEERRQQDDPGSSSTDAPDVAGQG
jgi:Spy/CpxP family protein refolding chaperone